MARRSGPGPESAKQRGEMEAADELPSAMSPEILLAMTLAGADALQTSLQVLRKIHYPSPYMYN